MSYTKTNWQDLPNTTTPITASNLNNMENGIEKSDKVIGGEEYDSTATYEIGDFCIYNNKLYRCITAISTAEAFTPAHWEETSVENELDALRKSGGIPTNSVIGYDDTTVPSGFEEIDIDDFDVATQSKNGMMSASDKIKLDNILTKTGNNATINLNSVEDGIRIVNGWSGNVTNKPSNCGWAILIQNSNIDSSTKVQILLGLNTSSNGSIFIRLFESNSWGSWKTIT